MAHDAYRDLRMDDLLVPGGLLADVKGVWRDLAHSTVFRYWSL